MGKGFYGFTLNSKIDSLKCALADYLEIILNLNKEDCSCKHNFNNLRSLGYGLLVISVILATFGSKVSVSAQSSSFFTTYLQQIQSSLPVGLVMRLPNQILLDEPLDIEAEKLIVRIFPSQTPPSLTVSVFTCDRTITPCLIGSILSEPQTSVSALRELARHQKKGKNVLLKNKIQGYLLAGPKQKPSYQFSSLMWQQDEMIYRITFPAIEQKNIIVMATAMANSTPIQSVAEGRK